MHDCDVKIRYFAFYGGRKEAKTKFSFRRVRLHLTKYVGRNNAIKTERTQIHFLSDVLFCRLVVGSGVKVSFAKALLHEFFKRKGGMQTILLVTSPFLLDAK